MYSIITDNEEGKPLRINGELELDSKKLSMILRGETLQIIPPEGEGTGFPLLHSRIDETEAKRYLEEAQKEDGAAEEVTEPVEPEGEEE